MANELIPLFAPNFVASVGVDHNVSTLPSVSAATATGTTLPSTGTSSANGTGVSFDSFAAGASGMNPQLPVAGAPLASNGVLGDSSANSATGASTPLEAPDGSSMQEAAAAAVAAAAYAASGFSDTSGASQAASATSAAAPSGSGQILVQSPEEIVGDNAVADSRGSASGAESVVAAASHPQNMLSGLSPNSVREISKANLISGKVCSRDKLFYFVFEQNSPMTFPCRLVPSISIGQRICR